jgi:hypothetical protein
LTRASAGAAVPANSVRTIMIDSQKYNFFIS